MGVDHALAARGEAAEAFMGHACRLGMWSACNVLGVWLNDRELFEKGCAAGDRESCLNLGVVLTRKGERRSRELFESACSKGSARGCRLLALLFAGGKLVSKDPRRSEVLLDLACAADDQPACAHRGRVDRDSSLEIWRRGHWARYAACLMGSEATCAMLARAYQGGLAIEQDTQRAEDLYRRACKSGVGAACVGLARMAVEGTASGDFAALLARVCERHNRDSVLAAVCSDPTCRTARQTSHLARAVAAIGSRAQLASGELWEEGLRLELPSAWYAQACEHGDQPSCLRSSPAQALLVHEARCVQGSLAACLFVAESYVPPGVPPDEEAAAGAAEYVERACDMDHGPSCARLGVWLVRGWGLAAQPRRGAALLRRACHMRVLSACDELERLDESP